ncbi:MAG: FAD-binding oxidoreductase [Gammaproteobacteria bacterium]|jgi:gamma-glutamylputrescine oxidase|nr:FAD-binding oxidoreductase [Gammaproteobacteria bacterium]
MAFHSGQASGQGHTHSWYAASSNLKLSRPRLEQHLVADVCIVGAGITGLSAALELAQQGLQVAVLEANCIAWGASGRSGGQMIFGYGCDMSVLEKAAGKNIAKAFWDMSLEGMALIRQRIDQHQIDCNLQDGHLHAAIKPRHMQELQAWQQSLQEDYGYQSLQLWQQQDLHEHIASKRYLGGLYDSNSGHLHPLNYTLGLAQAALNAGVKIFEQSPVIKVDTSTGQHLCHTPKGRIKANYLVYAGNAYLGDLEPRLRSRIMPVGTYIGATSPLGKEQAKKLIRNNMAVADMNYALDYFRFSDDYRLLFGGRVSYTTIAPANLKKTMYKRMTQVFPQLKDITLDFAWGGNIAITMNRGPHFGHLGNDIYFAQGFSGHGIATTNLAGKLMAEAITGQAGRLDLFNQLKHMPFPGGTLWRTPALLLATAWYRLRDYW